MKYRLLAAGLGKSRQVGHDGKSCSTKVILYKRSKNPAHSAGYVLFRLLAAGLGKSRQV